MGVRLSEIPIDVLYNKKINVIKGIEMSGVAGNSFVPIEFHIEQDAFTQNGDFEITYKSHVNRVDIEERCVITNMTEKADNNQFIKELQ